ncbi:hypothetical protein GOBAR_DD11940 [Gossypium barbadense]|nr:hypothetical protein GOBAR_DD11940 [Gossypium barbadense]
MAEIAVGIVIDRLISFLGAEVKLFGRLKKEVEDIRIELDYIACFLRQADPMIEDVMDEYKLYHVPVAQHQQQQGLMASLSRIAHMVQTVKRHLQAASKIRDIKTSVNEIKERSERYRFNTLQHVPGENCNEPIDPRMGLHFVNSEALVGIDSSRQELARRLADAELKRTIVSVVGMGGVGKTTLVKKAFDDEIMAGHFDCHAWITVSQSYRVEVLLRTMMKQMYESRKQSPPVRVDAMDGVELISICRDYIYDKSYIVVFDDVWKEDFWRHIEHALLDNNKGSRILMTTRSTGALTQNCLFSMMKINNRPEELNGLFLFMGMFPEDYPISCKRLIRLWIAEGFVKGKHNMTLEEVAMTYLSELINRSLVQVSVIDSIGNVRNCQLHDLMREVVVSKSKELSFIQTCPENLSNHYRVARHLSICNKSNNFPMVVGNYQTHSAIFFDIEELPKSFCFLQFTKSKLLKELDFEGAPLTYIPEELGNLFNLKYLSIRDTKVKKLPRSIGKLHKLQTLDLKRSFVSELPVEINMLFNLQYLVAYYKDKQSIYSINTRRGMKLYSNFGSLESLEKLYEVDLEAYSGGNFFRELARLKRLRKLCITKLKSESVNALCDAIQQMIHLQSLRISSIKEEELLHLHKMSSPPVFLRCLRLRGRLMKLPGWIYELRNLTKLTLEWSRISDDSLQILGVLPNLLFFWIFEGYSGAQLHFHKNHFKKLKDLRLCWLNDLKRLIIDEGSLTLVEHLELGPSPQLEELPATISHLKCLKTLSFNNMPMESVRKLLPDGGSDHWKVRHIPNIYFLYFTVKGTQHETYKLGDSRLLELLS